MNVIKRLFNIMAEENPDSKQEDEVFRNNVLSKLKELKNSAMYNKLPEETRKELHLALKRLSSKVIMGSILAEDVAPELCLLEEAVKTLNAVAVHSIVAEFNKRFDSCVMTNHGEVCPRPSK